MNKESQKRQELLIITKTLSDTLKSSRSPRDSKDCSPASSPRRRLPDIAREEGVKATQTLETSFKPCDECASCQESLRKTGDVIIDLCKQHGLPSTLAKCRKQLENVTWFSRADVTRWSGDTNADLNRLRKYLKDFFEVKEDLQIEMNKNNELKNTISDLKRDLKSERDTQNLQTKEYKHKLRALETENADMQLEGEKTKKDWSETRSKLEQQLAELRVHLASQEESMQEIGEFIEDDVSVRPL